MKRNISLLIAKGASTSTSNVVRRYVGIAPAKVLSVNPSKADLEKIYSTPDNPVTLEKEPSYYSVDEAGVKTARINFLVEISPKLTNGESVKTSVSYFLKDQIQYNRDNTKVQVINAFGESTWLTVEEAKAGKIPDRLKWFDGTGVRPAMVGEENLVKFIKALSGIPNKSYTRDGVTVTIPDVTAAYCQLDNIKKYFDGDISELVAVVEAWTNQNMVKLLFGVKTTPDNKMYQDIFIQTPLKNSARDNAAIIKEVRNSKEIGRYPNTYFGEEPYEFGEYVPKATNLEEAVAKGSEDDSTVPAAGWWK